MCAKDEGEDCGFNEGAVGTCKHEMWCLKECGKGLFTRSGIPFGPYGSSKFLMFI